MLNLFAKRRHNNPLSDPKSTTHWLNELKVRDAYAAQQEIVRALAEFNEQGDFNSVSRLKVVLQLDEGAQPMQSALCRQYLQNPRMSRMIESRLWNAIESFSATFTQAYHASVMSYVAQPNGSKIVAQLPLLTVRAIYHLAVSAKWQHFRYEPIAKKTWSTLHNLYRFAEFEEFERSRLKLYDDAEFARETSVADEYLRVMMLNALHPGGLTPKQIELADVWLMRWTPLLEIERDYDRERHVFHAKLDDERGARRIRRPAEDAMQRYWGTDRLHARISEALHGLRRGEMSAKAELSEDCRLPACAEFLEYALLQWGPTGPKRVQRLKERSRSMKMIEVVKSFNDFHQLIRHDNFKAMRHSDPSKDPGVSYDEMLDVRLYGFVTQRTQERRQASREPEEPKYESERWIAENESESGFGASIAESREDWVTLGKLFALRPERGAQWLIGVVRRLSKLESAQRYVGMEIICHTPFAVQMRLPGETRMLTVDGIDPVGAHLPTLALYLPKARSNRAYDTILLPAGEYARSNSWQLELQGKVYIIELKGDREKGDGWVRSAFEVKSKKLAREH